MKPTSPAKSNAVSVAGLSSAVLGIVLMAWGFMAGIDAALSGSGNGPGLFVAMFFLGAALVLAALVLATYHVARRRALALSWITLAACAVPGIAVIAIVVASRA